MSRFIIDDVLEVRAPEKKIDWPGEILRAIIWGGIGYAIAEYVDDEEEEEEEED